MSLILEALRKLDRDKASPEARPTVVMMAPLPWGGTPAGSRRRVALVAAVAVFATIVVAAGFVVFFGLPGSTSPKPQATAVPAALSPPSPSSTTAADQERSQSASAADRQRTEEDLPRAIELPPRPPIAVAPPVIEPSPTPQPSSPPPRFALSAIGERDGHPIAMINDQIVRVGDRIAGAEVTHIGPTSVDLLLDGQPIHLSF